MIVIIYILIEMFYPFVDRMEYHTNLTTTSSGSSIKDDKDLSNIKTVLSCLKQLIITECANKIQV